MLLIPGRTTCTRVSDCSTPATCATSSSILAWSANLNLVPSPPAGYHGPKGDELDEEIDDKIYVEEEHNFVQRKNKKYPLVILHYNQVKAEEPVYTSDNPQET